MSTNFWPWFLGAAALAAVAALVPLLLRRPFGVSGAVRTVLFGARDEGLPRGTAALLLVGSVLGGVIASALHPTATAGGFDATFVALFGSGGVAAGVLLVGGVLVGAGTRLAGGCTSGHGLTGCGRAQPGSLAATASFFGVAIVTSLVLGAVLS